MTRRLLGGIALALMWWLVTREQTPHERLLFPPPESVLDVIGSQPSALLGYAAVTWWRVIVGLVGGALVGFSLGLTMTRFPRLERAADPLIELLRPVPPVALAPFAILWFGLGFLSQFVIIALGAFMVVVVSVVSATRNVSPVYTRAARSLGATDRELYRSVIVPAIMPELASSVRIATGTAFGLAIAAEYLGAQGGLGYLIRNARATLQTEVILVATILLGLEAWGTDRLTRSVFRRITRWMPRELSWAAKTSRTI